MNYKNMNQLSTEVKTHVLITFSGSKHMITDEQEKTLRKASDQDRIYIGSTMIRVSTIKQVMPIEEYYQQFPEERPQYSNYSYKPTPEMPYSAKRHYNAIVSMRSGFLKHFNGRELNNKAQKILDVMNYRIKNFKPGDTANPGAIYVAAKQ